MKKILPALVIASLLSSTEFASAARGQEMPAPRRMPRTPVSRESLVSPHDVAPPSHQASGMATIIDGDKLRVGESDLRLFGIVPPQLAASFGPQARGALDSLTSGQIINCAIRDRDREGRMLAICHNAAGHDLAMELLKRGLAVTARGSLTNTEYAAPYLAAEQAAQNAHTGLWSVAPPTAAPSSAYVASPSVAPASVAPPAPAPVATPAATPLAALVKPATPVAPEAKTEIKKEEPLSAKIAADVATQQAQARIDDAAWNPAESVGFFERYQILIACGLMLATTLSIITALWAQKRRDRMDEMKAVAAALRGELMAARSICIGRAKSITTDEEDNAALWPRIRSTLYQASVGRLGILGADMARHIASIYGQSGDYAALYSPTHGTQEAPKKHALETLAKHIDAVLPTLAHVEKTGALPTKPLAPSQAALAYRSMTLLPIEKPLSLSAPPQAIAKSRETSAIHKAATAQATIPAEIAQEITQPQKAESISGATPPIKPIPPTPIARASASLWDNVRNLLKTQRETFGEPESDPQTTEYSEYAALIEADMAQYQYGSTIESLDISPQKKQG